MEDNRKFGEFEVDQTQITSLNFNEPELRSFSVADIFEPVEPKPRKRFGKRADRRAAEVKVKVLDAFEEDKPRTDGSVKEMMQLNINDIKEEPKQEIVEEIIEEVVEQPIQDEPIVEQTVEMKPIVEKVEETVEEPVEEVIEKVAEEVIEEPVVEEAAEEIVEEVAEEPIVEEESEAELEKTKVMDTDYDQSQEDSDEYDEDELLYEKKGFLISHYDKKEKYLEKHSKDGYHFVRSSGKKFYFREGAKKDYYYNYAYFKNEPTDAEWAEFEKDGWKLVSRNKAKKKRDAGWFVFRNEDLPGEYRKTIDTDLNKYNFFKKEVSSYRSTEFLLFICMVICVISAYLQYMFSGYLASLVACGVIFFIAFIYFLRYARLSFGAKKKKKLLKSKLRIKEKEEFLQSQNEVDLSESVEDLNKDWDTLEDVVKDRKNNKKRRR